MPSYTPNTTGSNQSVTKAAKSVTIQWSLAKKGKQTRAPSNNRMCAREKSIPFALTTPGISTIIEALYAHGISCVGDGILFCFLSTLRNNGPFFSPLSKRGHAFDIFLFCLVVFCFHFSLSLSLSLSLHLSLVCLFVWGAFKLLPPFFLRFSKRGHAFVGFGFFCRSVLFCWRCFAVVCVCVWCFLVAVCVCFEEGRKGRMEKEWKKGKEKEGREMM